MSLPIGLIAIMEALATASTTTQPRRAGKNGRFLGPCELEIERAASVGGASIYGVSRNGPANPNRQDFYGDGVATIYDSAIAFVALANFNWLLYVDKSTRTGTATVTVGSTTVTGAGSAFTTEFNVGDELTINGERKTIVSITSATVLNTDTAYNAAAAGVAIFLNDALLVPTTDFALSSNGGLCRITLTAAAKLPLGARMELHFVVPRLKFTFATATVIFKTIEMPGDEFLWYVSDATGTPSSTNAYVRPLGL